MRTERGRRDAWHDQPVFWLGALLLGASLAGCVVTIVLAARHADAALPTAGGQVLKVPLQEPAATRETPP